MHIADLLFLTWPWIVNAYFQGVSITQGSSKEDCINYYHYYFITITITIIITITVHVKHT